MDGVVQENVILKSFPLFDIAQVEVSRGPQGTLFGRNTTAGIVKFDSVRPTQETDGYGSRHRRLAGHGECRRRAGRRAVRQRGLVGPGLASVLRTATTGSTTPFRASTTPWAASMSWRAALQLLFAPNESFDALFNIHARIWKAPRRCSAPIS
jgi:iron complex outermembrane receptor protein